MQPLDKLSGYLFFKKYPAAEFLFTFYNPLCLFDGNLFQLFFLFRALFKIGKNFWLKISIGLYFPSQKKKRILKRNLCGKKMFKSKV